jgi:ADP-ribose pyrophosphatase YjhB (NUDIX family)
MNRHFTVAVFIVHQGKTLLHLHKKLGMWLPVGGHVDPNESPCEAAIRETKEEAGIDIELYDPRRPKFENVKNVRPLVPPMHAQNEVLGPDHEHIDYIFYARASTFELKPLEGEAMEIGWYTREEMEKMPLVEDVREYAREGFELLK